MKSSIWVIMCSAIIFAMGNIGRSQFINVIIYTVRVGGLRTEECNACSYECGGIEVQLS
jgi:hypothetical protein